MGPLEWQSDITFSIAMNKYIDEIYKSIWPIESITRLTRETQPHILDSEFHIDTILKLKNQMIITAQEKVRRLDKIKYQEFTLEYMSNNRGEFGEYMKLCTDIYFYGYGDTTQGFKSWYIFKPIDIKNAISNNELSGILKENVNHSTANFYCYKFADFKKEWFISSYNEQSETPHHQPTG